MHLNKFGMYQATPGGICLQGEAVSLKMEFVAENIFRMWTTLQDAFRQERKPLWWSARSLTAPMSA